MKRQIYKRIKERIGEMASVIKEAHESPSDVRWQEKVVRECYEDRIDELNRLLKWVRSDLTISNKFVSSWIELRKIVSQYQQDGERVVFTNGVFDLIHAGHAHMLSYASALGDVLIVGLNSDRSAREQKGPGRPILKLWERAAILSKIEFVDFVTVFDEDVPDKLIEKLKPDVLVKGEEYKGHYILGSDYVKEVRLCPMLAGVSTTNIIERAHDAY